MDYKRQNTSENIGVGHEGEIYGREMGPSADKGASEGPKVQDNDNDNDNDNIIVDPETGALHQLPEAMAPIRQRNLPKEEFAKSFGKLRSSTYTDNTRQNVPVSSSHYVRTLSWNAPGTLIATGAADRTLRVWNPERTLAKNSTELKGHTGGVERVAFHPGNETELASCSSDGSVRFWDVRSKNCIGSFNFRSKEQAGKDMGDPFTLAWKPDGTEMIIGTKNDYLVQFDRAMLKPVADHKQPIQTNQCTFNWAGNRLFLTGGDGCVKIVKYPTFEHVYTLNAHTSACFAVTMSPSGLYLGIGAGDALISLWDTEEWICPRTIEVPAGQVKSVDFSFDGSFVTGGSDEGNRLAITHVETGEEVYHIDTNAPAAHVAWHPSRYVLAYSAENQGLKIHGGVSGTN